VEAEVDGVEGRDGWPGGRGGSGGCCRLGAGLGAMLRGGEEGYVVCGIEGNGVSSGCVS
jgi:hypothetical protein